MPPSTARDVDVCSIASPFEAPSQSRFATGLEHAIASASPPRAAVVSKGQIDAKNLHHMLDLNSELLNRHVGTWTYGRSRRWCVTWGEHRDRKVETGVSATRVRLEVRDSADPEDRKG